MKKIFFILAGVIFLVLLLNINHIESFFWKMIDNRLEYERSLEVGDEFNIVTWGDCSFQINHNSYGKSLDYCNNDMAFSILSSVTSYKMTTEKFYVVSHEGYAVVDGLNNAKVYLKSDKYGAISCENIKYVTSFSEFDEEEQKMLKKIK